MYGLANRSVYSSTSSARRDFGIVGGVELPAEDEFTAPSAPITATSADGHANARSAPIDFEFMTTYAPP